MALKLRRTKIHCEYHAHNWPLAASDGPGFYNFSLQLRASTFEHVSVLQTQKYNVIHTPSHVK